MSLFCPSCHCLLILDGTEELFSLVCSTCSYNLPINQTVKCVKKLSPIEPEDAAQLELELSNTEKICRKCPECQATEAYKYALRLRDADERDTVFAQCTGCNVTVIINE